MPSIALIGAQWGDEGKGRIADFLADGADLVVRFQGGANAGHTVVVGDRTIRLHLLPVGVIRGVTSILAEGMAVDLEALEKEIADLEGAGIRGHGEIRISDRAHLVLPHHRALDSGGGRVGTTSRGIGPCYTDRSARIGVRAGDLLDDDELAGRLDVLREAYPDRFRALGGGWARGIPDVFRRWRDRFGPFIADTGAIVRRAHHEGKRILFEGGQGVLLDVSAGTYPYVTSSHTTVSGICVGAGVPPAMVERTYGVAKAYTTRVGDGPFPTELTDGVGTILREKGREYGSTTGRPRRCGWLDGVALRYACETNGFTGLILTKLDILSGIRPVRLGVGYRLDGRPLDLDGGFPASARLLGRVEVVYEDMEGWDEEISGARSLDDLPAAARRYIARVEEVAGTPIVSVSVGAERRSVVAPRSFW